ncbi:unnamed protein product [Cylicostephanus goldi]|uniref:Uncharacterized protein n=1 Tax=Cylicostephanus goldi TaxID=71465 RepID=A0A3P6RNJ8_CYLGO|nr:unnamed protein product [Cylicostephanus goldi]
MDTKEQATVDASNVRAKSGPLGELSEQYDVKVVVKSDGESESATHKHVSRKERRGRFQSRHRKDSPKKDD